MQFYSYIHSDKETKVAEILLSHEADPDILDKDGSAALHQAVLDGN